MEGTFCQLVTRVPMVNSYKTLQDFLLDDYFIDWVKHPTASSNRYWEAWQVAHPNRRAMLQEARAVILTAQQNRPELSDQEVQAMWQSLQTRHRKTPNTTQRWLRIAVSLTGILLLSSLLYWGLVSEKVVTYRTAYGETKKVLLPDGSAVMLNSNSTLSHAADWEERASRCVSLQGEAYFQVHHTEDNRKFLVDIDPLVIEVVGTSFNVNRRPGRTQVVLDEGRVTLHQSDEVASAGIVMQPGELVEINNSQLVQKKVNLEPYTAWIEHELVFDGTTLEDIAQLLEDNYGYDIQIMDTVLANKRFRGRAPADDVESLLGQLEKVFPLVIERNNNDMLWRSRAPQPVE